MTTYNRGNSKIPTKAISQKKPVFKAKMCKKPIRSSYYSDFVLEYEPYKGKHRQ